MSKKLGNENSYTKEFYEELYKKIKVTDKTERINLERAIMLATQAYLRKYTEHKTQLPPHQVKKELQKAVKHIDKAAESLIKVYKSANYGTEIVNNLSDVILVDHPSLHGFIPHVIRKNSFGVIHSPVRSLELLEAMARGTERTIEKLEAKKTTARSVALYHWLMILSTKLEPILNNKLEQSHYYKTEKGGEFISSKAINDSDLLLFMIKPLDPQVTPSQMETAIKETHEERHKRPWDDYFPYR